MVLPVFTISCGKCLPTHQKVNSRVVHAVIYPDFFIFRHNVPGMEVLEKRSRVIETFLLHMSHMICVHFLKWHETETHKSALKVRFWLGVLRILW